MSENENQNEAAQPAQANFALQRIYVKDISFESPNSPAIFQKQWKPEVKMDLNTKNTKLGDDHYEVVVSASGTITPDSLDNGSETTSCTQQYSRSLEDDGEQNCDAGHILANRLGGYGNIPTAVAAIKEGAIDYLAKPADADDVEKALLADPEKKAEPPENPMSADRVKWEHIHRVFELCNRNVSETARRLKMHRRTLQRILSKRSPR